MTSSNNLCHVTLSSPFNPRSHPSPETSPEVSSYLPPNYPSPLSSTQIPRTLPSSTLPSPVLPSALCVETTCFSGRLAPPFPSCRESSRGTVFRQPVSLILLQRPSSGSSLNCRQFLAAVRFRTVRPRGPSTADRAGLSVHGLSALGLSVHGLSTREFSASRIVSPWDVGSWVVSFRVIGSTRPYSRGTVPTRTYVKSRTLNHVR